MSRDNDVRKKGSADPFDERRFLEIWRIVAIAVDTVLIIFTTVIDSMARLLIDPNFHVSEIIFGGLITSWLVLLGLETYQRVVKNGHGEK